MLGESILNGNCKNAIRHANQSTFRVSPKTGAENIALKHHWCHPCPASGPTALSALETKARHTVLNCKAGETFLSSHENMFDNGLLTMVDNQNGFWSWLKIVTEYSLWCLPIHHHGQPLLADIKPHYEQITDHGIMLFFHVCQKGLLALQIFVKTSKTCTIKMVSYLHKNPWFKKGSSIPPEVRKGHHVKHTDTSIEMLVRQNSPNTTAVWNATSALWKWWYSDAWYCSCLNI